MRRLDRIPATRWLLAVALLAVGCGSDGSGADAACTGGCADLAGRDLAGADLAPPRDLAGADLAGADLAVPADFSSLPDLTPPGDLTVSSADYYLDPVNGSDANPGTSINMAWKTLDHARTQVQPLAGTKPLTIALRGGTYYGTSVTFAAADSGTQANPILYVAYGNETPVLSGGQRVTGWMANLGNCGANCFRVTLPQNAPDFAALYYNGARRLRPRLGAGPLGQYFRVSAQDMGCGGPCLDRFYFAKGDPIATTWANYAASAGNPCGAQPGPAALQGDIELYAFEKWDAAKMRISCIDLARTNGGAAGGEIYLTGSTGAAPNHGYLQGHRYLVENVKDALKAGQFFIDKSAAPWTLTYLGQNGENPNNDTVVIPQAAQVIVANSLSFVTFRGITFAHDNYVVPKAGYPSRQQDPALPAAVHCQACKNVTFDDDTFTQTSAYGIDCIGACDGVTVSNSLGYDLGGGGVRFGLPSTPNDTEANVPQNMAVTNSGFAGVGRVFPSGDCIQYGDLHDSKIQNTECAFSYHDGIEICQPSGNVCAGNDLTKSHGVHDLLVQDNVIHHVGLGVTNDLACIYAMTHLGNGSGTNNRAIHNLCHDVSDASGTDGDGYGGHGLYFDNNTGNWLAENNLVYRVSATGYNMTAGPLVANQPNTYHNNIAAYARQSVVGVSACASAATIQQLVFADNLVYEDRGASAIQKGGGRYFYNNPTSIQDWNHNQYFSKAVNYSTDAMMFATENNPPDQNGTCMGQTQRTFAAWQGLGEDTGSKIGDPGFTAPSPCANGMPQPGVCDDYSLQNFAGVGFAPFPLTGWGRTSGPSLPQVPDTFVTAAFDPTKDF